MRGWPGWLLQLCNDRRGIWLTVAILLVHVNGRPVLQLAMLRAGDSVHQMAKSCN